MMPIKRYALAAAIVCLSLLVPPSGLAQECTPDCSYVADVTVPDDTIMGPGESFQKIWRVQNTGTCEWEPGYTWTFLQGESMGAPPGVGLLPNVKPGQAIDIAVSMIAPTVPGTYASYWQMADGSDRAFGPIFFVRIVVPAEGKPAAPVQPAATPAVQPTVQALPTAAAEWKRFTTEELEISLPPGYEGGNPSDGDLRLILDGLRQLGAGYEDAIRLVEENSDAVVFLAIDVSTLGTGFATNVTIAKEQVPSFLPMSQLLPVLAPQLTVQGFRVLEQQEITLAPYEAGKFALESTKLPVTVRQIVYLLKDGSSLWAVSYTTRPEEIEQRMPEFEQSIRTFKHKS